MIKKHLCIFSNRNRFHHLKFTHLLSQNLTVLHLDPVRFILDVLKAETVPLAKCGFYARSEPKHMKKKKILSRQGRRNGARDQGGISICFSSKVFNYLLQIEIQEVRVQKQVEMRRFAGVHMRVQEIQRGSQLHY